MKARTLLNKKQVAEYSETHRLSIETKCPGKWLFIDLETGEVWKQLHEDYNMERASEKDKKALLQIAIKEILE